MPDYSESAAGSNGQTGCGIEFAKGTGNTIFAEVFLAQDFLDAFGVTESSTFADRFIHDVFDTSLVTDDKIEECQKISKSASGVYRWIQHFQWWR